MPFDRADAPADSTSRPPVGECRSDTSHNPAAPCATPGVVLAAIPCYGHRERLPDVVRSVHRYLFPDDVVIVDDGSVPPLDPADVIGSVLLRHARNEGLTRAVGTAIEYALGRGVTGLVKLDADGQMDVDAMPEFLTALREGFDVVLGTFDEARTPRSERLADRLFCVLFRLGTAHPVPTVLAEYRGYSSTALELLRNDRSPPWASPLGLFRLQSLKWCTVERCISLTGTRSFPVRGMWQLRVTFLKHLLREHSVRATAVLPLAAAALFAHMFGHLVGRGVAITGARLSRPRRGALTAPP